MTVVDRQRGPALETSYRQCRRGVARLFGALGRARRAAQGDQVAADAPQPAGDQADARPGDVALGPGDAAQLHRGALRRSTRAAWCGWPNTAATACAQLRAETGIALRRAHAGHAAAVPHAEAARRHRQGHRDAASSTACPSSCSTVPASSATSRRWPRCSDKFVGGAAPAGRRDRRLLQVHPGAGRRWPQQLGVQFRFGIAIERPGARGRRASPACAPTPAR